MSLLRIHPSPGLSSLRGEEGEGLIELFNLFLSGVERFPLYKHTYTLGPQSCTVIHTDTAASMNTLGIQNLDADVGYSSHPAWLMPQEDGLEMDSSHKICI